jgi:hypothetical protein
MSIIQLNYRITVAHTFLRTNNTKAIANFLLNKFANNTIEDGYISIDKQLKPLLMKSYENATAFNLSKCNSLGGCPVWYRSLVSLIPTLGIIGNVSKATGILILNGENDSLTPVQQAFLLQQRLTEFSISLAVVVTVAVFVIGSIATSVYAAEPSNFTVNLNNPTGPVMECVNGKNLTSADLQAGKTCPSSPPITVPPIVTPTITPPSNSTAPEVTPTPIVNSTPPVVPKPATMVIYKDPRFTMLHPSDWTATPQTNRFETTLVNFDAALGNSLSVSTNNAGGSTDPEAVSRSAQNILGFRYTVFQPVECAKYTVDGAKACSIILTKPADLTLGTPGRVVLGIETYVKGSMYTISAGSDENTFDTVLPTFDKMIHSLHFGGNSISVGPAGSGIATGSNVLH